MPLGLIAGKNTSLIYVTREIRTSLSNSAESGTGPTWTPTPLNSRAIMGSIIVLEYSPGSFFGTNVT